MDLSPSAQTEEVIVVPLDLVVEKVEVTYTRAWYLPWWMGKKWKASYTINVTDGEGNSISATTDAGNRLKTGQQQTLALI